MEEWTKQGRFVGGTEVFNTFAYDYLGEVIKRKIRPGECRELCRGPYHAIWI